MIIKHLLPNAKAWRITLDKNLKRFFGGLDYLETSIKSFYDLLWVDINPQTTRQITEWEDQFGLNNSMLTEQQRRDRLSASWSAFGGQSPKYIQDKLQAFGFNVYIHEWWEPASRPAVGIHAAGTPRNPFLYINSSTILAMVDCGEALAQCGEAFAQAGNTVNPPGYLLVNKILVSQENFTITCGEALAQAGESLAQCGQFDGFVEFYKEYTLPFNQDYWSYILYIGGQTFGTMAQVPPARKDEFEALCLRLKPAQQWLGMLVDYV